MNVTLPPPNCQLGYPKDQVEAIVVKNGRDVDEFWSWMRGQTMGICDGARWNPETQSHDQTHCGPHGACVYRNDLCRFLDRLPVID